MSAVGARRAGRIGDETGAVSLVRLLGSFQLRVGGEAVTLPAAAQRLVALLALRHGPVSRVSAAGVLWLDVPDERAAASLRTTLWRCRQEAPQLVATTSCQVQLGTAVEVDVHHAEAAVRGLLDSAAPLAVDGLPGVHRVLELLSTDLLVDWYEDWVILERERHRQRRLHALEALCTRLSLAGCHAAAVEAALAAVAAEPLRESAQRALIGAHLAEGNHGEALRQYRVYHQLVHAELGFGPSAELQQRVAAAGVSVPACGTCGAMGREPRLRPMAGRPPLLRPLTTS